MMDEKQVYKQLDKIKEIPTLPTIVFELNQHLQNPESSIAKVSETIEKDQAMSLKILKLVNSAFYGFQSKVSDVKNAVVLLGFNAVRNAIISVSVINALPKTLLFQDFEMIEFWKHSLAVAVTSKNIAQKAGMDSADNCFVGGLLHDVGKVIMAQYFKDEFVKVWTRMQKEFLPFYDAEQKELAVDHTKIGAYLAERWKLPRGLNDAIRWHHDFQPDNGNAGFMMNIHLADILVNSYDENPDCTIDMSAMHPAVAKFLMAQLEDSSDWYTNLAGEIETAHAFFLGDEF
jgi:putative nucleotidyltransferase with HDIG domain